MRSTNRSDTAVITILYFVFALQAVIGVPLLPARPGLDQTSLTPAEKLAISAIDKNEIRQITTELTSDKYQGRGAAQPGGAEAARYIADRFRQAGLKPLGDGGSYLQRVDLRGYRIGADTTVTLDGTTLEKDRDFLFMPFDASRFPLSSRMDASGDVVLVGYGLDSATPARHDLDGISVKGKIALLFEGVPANAKLEEWAGVNTAPIVQDLSRRGAAAILILGSEQFPKALLDLAARRGVALYEARSPKQRVPPVLSITSTAAAKLFASAGMDLESITKRADAGEYVSADLHRTASISLRLRFERDPAPSFNVIGYLPGSDPALAKQAVVFTAHHDAYGIEPDGRIFPGAGDDAVNVANMIEIAKALSNPKVRGRRSILFIATTGEELWKLGAFHWTEHPTWPLGKVAADLNMDGIGSETWGEMTHYYAIGIQQTDMQKLISETSATLGVEVVPDTLVNAQLLQRSDAFEFARHGIPFIYGIGLPGDLSVAGPKFGPTLRDVTHYELDKIDASWNWNGPAKYAELLAVLALRISNAPSMPSWVASSPFDKPRG